MNKTYVTKAIILRRRPFRERDSRVFAYSREYGLLSLVARGTVSLKSKLAGYIEPLSYSFLMVAKGRQWDYLAGADLLKSYGGIKSDYEKSMAAGKASAFLSKNIKDNSPDPALFDLSRELLEAVDCMPPGRDYESIVYLFLLKVMNQLGYRPELYRSVVSGQTVSDGRARFDRSLGGLVCDNEENSGYCLPISQQCIKILRIALNKEISSFKNINIGEELRKEVKTVIKSFTEFH